jgi:hypothetical protein
MFYYYNPLLLVVEMAVLGLAVHKAFRLLDWLEARRSAKDQLQS